MKKPREEKNLVYTECVRIWLKEIHPGWTYDAIHGRKLKSIIRKIKQVCKNRNLEGTDEQVILSFKRMCLQLPTYFKDKDLHMIDSKFNEIIHQIQAGKQQSPNSYNSSQMFGKYGHLI